MAAAAPRLLLLQVPGAGLDRVNVDALSANTQLDNVYEHEAGIAEYVIGAMISQSRPFALQDKELRKGKWASQWAVGTTVPPLLPETGW